MKSVAAPEELELQALRARLDALGAQFEAAQSAAADTEALLRSMFEAAGVFVGAVERQGDSFRYLVANRATERYYGFAGRGLAGVTAEEVGFSRDEIDGWLALMDRCVAEGAVTLTYPFRLAGVQDGWWRGTYSSLPPGPDGEVRVAFLTQDITEAYMAELALRESEVRLRLAQEAASIGIWDWDLRTNAMVYSARAKQIYGLAADVGVTYEMIRAATHPNDLPRTSAMAEAARDPNLRPKIPFEYRIIWPDGQVRWALAHGEMVFEETPEGPRAVRYVGTLQDITDLKQAEERRKLLVNELNHRVKNTLATVQSMINQTLRGAQADPSLREQLSGRLMALSAAHDLLTRENWEAADLRALVEGALHPFGLAPARLRIHGPALRVGPKTATALAMALHELATNAAKYGAMASEAGRVSVSWTRPQQGRVRLEWREAEGPAVRPPVRRGFGVRLLTEGLATEFGSAAEIGYPPTGVVCAIAVPIVSPADS